MDSELGCGGAWYYAVEEPPQEDKSFFDKHKEESEIRRASIMEMEEKERPVEIVHEAETNVRIVKEGSMQGKASRYGLLQGEGSLQDETVSLACRARAHGGTRVEGRRR